MRRVSVVHFYIEWPGCKEAYVDPQLPARVTPQEVGPPLLAPLGPPNPQPAQAQRHRVSHRQRTHHAARRRRQGRVGLVRLLAPDVCKRARAGVEPAAARAREDRVGVAGDGDEVADAGADDGEEAHELGGRARVRDHEEGVAGAVRGAGADDAEVAVEGLERVEEYGRDACER